MDFGYSSHLEAALPVFAYVPLPQEAAAWPVASCPTAAVVAAATATPE